MLNIIGDLGNGSYGRVDNKSYLSLQYLVSGDNNTYRVLKINAKMHSIQSSMIIRNLIKLSLSLCGISDVFIQAIKPAMLLIDHDQYFIEQVADKRIKLAN